MTDPINVSRRQLANLCRRYGVRRLDMFGSAARGGELHADSDIDLLIDYDADRAAPRWSDFLALRDALGKLFGRPVDLVMNSAVKNPYIRAAIERSRLRLYGARRASLSVGCIAQCRGDRAVPDWP